MKYQIFLISQQKKKNIVSDVKLLYNFKTKMNNYKNDNKTKYYILKQYS